MLHSEAGVPETMQWFRWYTGTRKDQKWRSLTPEGRCLWTTLLELAGELDLDGVVHHVPGVPFTLDQLADEAKVTSKSVRPAIDAMVEMKMIKERPDGIFVINFAKRNYRSDFSVERTRKYRDGNATEKNRSCDGDVTVNNTPSDGDVTFPDNRVQNTDKEREENGVFTLSEEVIGLWNEVCVPKLSAVSKFTPTRSRHLKARLSDETRDLLWWRSYFLVVTHTPFLTGANDRKWKANFDFVIRSEDVVAKILEGQYGKTEFPHIASKANNDETFKLLMGE